MKEFVEKLIEKIKVTSLEIIVTGTKDKPYFEIKYKEVGKEDYNIGYSSYDLNNVFNWKDEYFEIVNQLAEEYNNADCSKCSRRSWYQKGYADAEKNNGWIPCSERLPEKYGEYLCCDTYGNFVLGFPSESDTSDTGFIVETEHEYCYDIIAWMELTEKYQKGE